MLENYILTIKAEDRLGLLHLITGIIEKRRIKIKSLNFSPTDIADIVLIHLELNVTESDFSSLTLKLENIIEVFSAKGAKYDHATCLRAS